MFLLPSLKIAVPNQKSSGSARAAKVSGIVALHTRIILSPTMSCILREKKGKLMTPNVVVGWGGDNRGGLQHVRLQLAQRKVTSCQGWR
jgi:hypothetical protein